MSRLLRMVMAAAGTALMLMLIAAVSGPEWRYHGDDSSRLRLSWGARPERIEVCRTLSEAELADRPEHMRQRLECEGTTASYALEIHVDGQEIDSRVLRGGGLRHDRPMYLLDDLVIAPGAHHLVVTLTRREEEPDDVGDEDDRIASVVDTGIFAGRAQRELEERDRRKRAAIPGSLRLDTLIVFREHEVKLMTFDAERQLLQLYQPAHEP
ncbi:MAG: hypothetical protein ABI542_03900 [Gemmatimonadota bacterium]